MPGTLCNSAGGMAIATPCIQLVPAPPAGEIPTPSVNVVTTATAIPNTPNVLYGGMPVINQGTENPVSTGSIPSGGMITRGLCQDSQNIGCSMTLNVGGMMAVSLADATGQNKDFNSASAYSVPCPPGNTVSLS